MFTSFRLGTGGKLFTLGRTFVKIKKLFTLGRTFVKIKTESLILFRTLLCSSSSANRLRISASALYCVYQFLCIPSTYQRLCSFVYHLFHIQGAY